MELDFQLAQRKLAREQSQRDKRADKLRQQKRHVDSLRKQQDRIRDAKNQIKRQAEQNQQQVLQQKIDTDLEKNKGVCYIQQFKPTLQNAAQQKGIKRNADIIELPPSARQALAGASHFGAATFALTHATTTTHAALCGYTAAEGTVGIPAHVWRQLELPLEGEPPSIEVRYWPLRKATFARLQPLTCKFQSHVTDVKELLESKLHLHATLTEGDLLEVQQDDQVYSIRIVSVQPEGAASLVETDLEVDILPSVEEEEAASAEVAACTISKEQDLPQRAGTQSEEHIGTSEKYESSEKLSSDVRAQRMVRREAARASLPTEPESGVNINVRCPDGSRTRIFARDDPLDALFAFIEAECYEPEDGPILPFDFRLVSTYPRRIFHRGQLSLEAAGLVGPKEALFVEY